MVRQALTGAAQEYAFQSFEARMRFLAGTHELLIANDWKGTDVATLVDRRLRAPRFLSSRWGPPQFPCRRKSRSHLR
jgi:two-component sensor histidine kinase